MKYGIRELVDVPKLQALTDELYRLTGIPSAFIAPDGEVLTGSGWQRICTEFHRGHPAIEKECIESDTAIRRKLDDGEPFAMYRCPRGLVDASSPVVIEGERVANVFCGQVFTEPPDDTTERLFREQARVFGLDEQAYMEAFREVPVITEERFRSNIAYLTGFAELIAASGMARIRELEAVREARDAERKYRAVADHTFNWEFWLDPGGHYVYVSPSCERITGYLPREFEDDPELMTRIIHPDDRAAYLAHETEALAIRMPRQAAFRLRRRDGVERWIEHVCTPVLGENGGFHGVRGSNRDATDRRQAEHALAESNRFTQQVITSAGEGIIVFGPDLRYQVWNPFMERLIGIPADQVLGRHPLEVFPFPWVNDMVERLERALAGEAQGSSEFCAAIPEHGSIGWVSDTSSPLRNAEGEIIGVIATVRDISERRRIEQEKESLQADLVQAHKMESVGRLAGGVAHDFNNMLGVILGHAELALELLEPQDLLYDDLVEIQRAARRSADLTCRLLAFARKQTISPRILDLNETVSGMLEMLRRLIGENIELVWRPGKDVWTVEVDPTQIDQILANLVVNARDAIVGGGLVTIRTLNVVIDETEARARVDVASGSYVLLTVSDTGVGIDQNTLDHIFEPFFTTKEGEKGTGLGLAMVYGILKQNHGFIDVRSEVGTGTSIGIHLPRADGRAKEQETASAEPAALHGTETVLFVEDQEAMLKLGAAVLERHGYKVLAASNPVEAYALVQRYPGHIQLLVTDVIMPVMNGRELEEKVRTLKPWIRCLFVSGYPADIIAPHGVLDDDVPFLQKPFTPVAFAHKVREVLDRT